MRLSARVAAGTVLGFLMLGTSRASGQAVAQNDATWVLEGAGGSYCIWYLADPALVRTLVPAATSLLPAGTGGDVPALASYIKEEPKFAQWIPGTICLGYYRKITSGGRTIVEAKPDKPPFLIATSSIAAQGAHGVAGANQYLLAFMTNDHGVSNAAGDMGVDMSSIEVSERTRSGDPTVTIAFDGVQIFWSGHAVADSSVGKTRSMSFGYGGPKGGSWQITLEATPQSSKILLGTLWIEGRNNLAKVLIASPARPIGPLENNGSTTIMFHAGTRH